MPPASYLPSRPWWQKIDPRSSLTARAVYIVSGTALIFVLIVAWISGALLQRQLTKQLGSAFENLAFQVGDKLDRTVYERYRQLQFTASLPPFRTPSAPAAERQALIESLHDASTDYAWIGFADSTGVVQASSQHLFEQEKANGYGWFAGAQRGPYVGTLRAYPEFSALSVKPGADAPRFLDVAVPVATPNGQPLGVLAALLRWDWAREAQLSVIPEISRRDRIGVTVYTAGGDVMLDSDGSGWTEPPEPPLNASPRRAARENFTETMPNGAVYLTGYSRSRGFREYRGLGWLVVVRQPVANAFTAVQELRVSIVRSGLGLVVLLALVAGRLASRIERRHRAITVAANRIGEGDIVTLIPRPQDDTDLARMCTALDRMVTDFRTREEAHEQTKNPVPTVPKAD